MKYYFIIITLMICLIFYGCNSGKNAEKAQTITVFSDDVIHFTPGDSTKYDTETVKARDNGRIISRTVQLPEYRKPVRITAYVATKPIPKDSTSVYDRWDRAGTVMLKPDNQPAIEILKFMTPFGGFTEHRVDVSQLAPLLKGECIIEGFVDTWVSPGWRMDFKITYEPAGNINNPVFVQSLMNIQDFNDKDYGLNGEEVEINIPSEFSKVVLYYNSSGHCTDGRDADEFISKDNVIYLDDKEIYRFKPWRDDCRNFRDVNPYTGKFEDGMWSSDYSRSGWCPGDKVLPVEVELNEDFPRGSHKVKFTIEDMRPLDENGHFGYWRISSYLAGWK